MRLLLSGKQVFLFICVAWVSSACGLIGGASSDPTSTPEPTSAVSGLHVDAPQACEVIRQSVIRVEEPQGDIVAWSPVADDLAYIAPTPGSTWNVGQLNLLTAPTFDNPKRLSTQAAGELDWSPQGRQIAFLSLRKSDNLYTIALVDQQGQKTNDLFPGEDAKTDDFAGQKAILDWVSEGRLRVLVSCGLDCMQRIDFGTLTGLSSPVGDPTQRSQDLWSVTNNHPEVIPTEYENLPGQLNWSPDGNFIAYIDERDNAWVINPADSTLYPLDIGTYSAAAETDWSFDGKYLAVRADQDLHIYKFDCP